MTGKVRTGSAASNAGSGSPSVTRQWRRHEARRQGQTRWPESRPAQPPWLTERPHFQLPDLETGLWRRLAPPRLPLLLP